MQHFLSKTKPRAWRDAIAWATLAVLAIIALCVAGCAQTPNMETDNETKTDQAAATQGSNVHLWIVNDYGRGKLPASGDGLALITADGTPEVAANKALENAISGDGQSQLSDADGRNVQNVSVVLTTGGTTPSLTGTATGTASPQMSAPFRIDPETGVAVPIGVAWPGGIVDQQASASGAGDVAAVKQSDNDARAARLEAAADKLETLLPILQALLTSPPAEPSETAPGDPG